MKLSRQEQMIVDAFHRAAPGNLTNRELNTICFRYGARLWDLSRKGFRFETLAVDAAAGLYTYRLLSDPADGQGPRGESTASTPPTQLLASTPPAAPALRQPIIGQQRLC